MASRRSSLGYARRYGVAFVILVLAFGAASFLLLLGLTAIEPTENVILAVTIINVVLVTTMLVLVGREVRTLLQARRRGRAAARMHIRIVGLFAIVAAFPAIIVAVVAALVLERSWCWLSTDDVSFSASFSFSSVTEPTDF